MHTYVLGIWDGHDSGAALLHGDSIVAAVNEERLSRRKLEIVFPRRAIRACLDMAALQPRDITAVAVSTSDFSKTVGRLFPSTKEDYYLLRRRKKAPGILSTLKKKAKYVLTEIGPGSISGVMSRRYIRGALAGMGISPKSLYIVDHHLCHAATAAFTAAADPCLVITLDGVGDGLSTTVSTCNDGKLRRIRSVGGNHSLGIFFEHVTNLLNMRELEDEGKVMALANYAYPVPDEENPMMRLLEVKDMSIRFRYQTLALYRELKKMLWRYPSEQFAYMAQRTIESAACELVRQCVAKTGLHNLAMAGGVLSNIKMNMRIRRMPEVDSCTVFPHMGDGGLALGAAMAVNHESNAIAHYRYNDLGWGTSYSEDDLRAAALAGGCDCTYKENIEAETARLIAGGAIVFWFQDRMEYGPRALGNRSILALPDSDAIKDLINMRLKMRVWYQPFCPSMLEDDARRYLEHFDGRHNRFMTMGYRVKAHLRSEMRGVTGIDGSCRPHIVTDATSRFGRLLTAIKDLTGRGILLNTSFNVHGDPLVCSPEDAVATLLKTGNEYLVMGNYLILGKEGSQS